jgi:DNA-binding XRE family transcriptional regulator
LCRVTVVESAASVIARAVRARRCELHLSTDDAAARARIPEKTWRVVEQGTAHPSRLVMAALCRALDWTPATIECLVRHEMRGNGVGEVVVDLLHSSSDAPEGDAVEPQVPTVTELDIEGLTPADLAEVQDFIDELRGDARPTD